MSRVIKFRIWCGTEGKYIKGGVLTQEGKYRRLDNKPECYTTEQFTGLHDNNGKEIYEGDIVEFEYCTCHIEYDLYSFTFIYIDAPYEWRLNSCEFTPAVIDIKECKVIGNIHENHELLEQAK